MARRRKKHTLKSFVKGFFKRKTGRGRRKFALLFLMGLAVTYYNDGIPTVDEAHQYISEDILLSDIKVLDGDTIRMGNKTYRLYGIDAPEKDQLCNRVDKEPWKCGREARSTLWKLTKGKQVTCKVKDTDRYNRDVAICYVGKTDLNRRMVETGMAMAYRQYSKHYVRDEWYAERNKLGIWQGKFTEPWKWRRSN